MAHLTALARMVHILQERLACYVPSLTDLGSLRLACRELREVMATSLPQLSLKLQDDMMPFLPSWARMAASMATGQWALHLRVGPDTQLAHAQALVQAVAACLEELGRPLDGLRAGSIRLNFHGAVGHANARAVAHVLQHIRFTHADDLTISMRDDDAETATSVWLHLGQALLAMDPQQRSHFKRLSLEGAMDMSPTLASALSHLPNISTLDLGNSEISASALGIAALAWPQLQRIDGWCLPEWAHEADLNDDDALPVISMPRVTHVSLADHGGAMPMDTILQHLPSLEVMEGEVAVSAEAEGDVHATAQRLASLAAGSRHLRLLLLSADHEHEGGKPLHVAAQMGHIIMVQALLAAGAGKDDADEVRL